MRGKGLVAPFHWLVLVGFVVLTYITVVGGAALLFGAGRPMMVPAFLAAAVCVAGLAVLDRRIGRLPPAPSTEIAAVAGKLPATGSWEQTLPTLARILAESTRAEHASLWLMAGGRLVNSAAWPSALAGTTHTVADIDALQAVPGVRHVVPVVDGHIQRGALAIGKSESAPETQERRMRDVAKGTALLLRSVSLANELQSRVRRAQELADELDASQQRLMHARDIERRRLVGDIGTVSEDGLSAIRTEIQQLRSALDADPESAAEVLTRLRATLEGVIERFRAVVRGVYPSVLRDGGPLAALRELCADLGRPVRVTGELTRRVDWEIESGLYYLAASAVRLFTGTEDDPVLVHFAQESDRITVRISAPTPAEPADLGAALANDDDRIAALGGEVRWSQDTRISVVGWLPDQLTPVVEESAPEPAESGAAPDGVEPLPDRINRLFQLVSDAVEVRIPISAEAPPERAALDALDTAVRDLPAGDPRRAALMFELAQIRSSSHDLLEEELLDLLRNNGTALSEDDRRGAARLLGAVGRAPCTRLALPVGSPPQEIQRTAGAQLEHWRSRAENPLAPREVREICRGVALTCEGLLQIKAE
ncbi:hypothetical protein [Saccharopolyspora sp. NPDC002686]|uniref:hypothetical protein n=1 Tax=Saccharopolyspora sp. NPDC002686 TaxID=3154541 RepID=UPI00333342C7